MKCPKCNQEIPVTDIKEFIEKLLETDWYEMVLKSANISTIGAEKISSAVKEKIQEIGKTVS